MQNLINDLSNYKDIILVDNDIDYSFLKNIKDYYSFNFEVFYYDDFIFNYKTAKFNCASYDFKYDTIIDKVIVCMDNISIFTEEFDIDNELILYYKSGDKKEYKNFYSLSNKDYLYINDFIYVTSFKNTIENNFKNKVKLLKKKNEVKNIENEIKYVFDLKEFNLFFLNPIYKKLNIIKNNFLIRGVYENESFKIFDIVINNDISKEEILNELSSEFSNITGFFNLNKGVSNKFYFDYKVINERIKTYLNENFF